MVDALPPAWESAGGNKKAINASNLLMRADSTPGAF
jgi:hypothetical protein